MITENEKNRIFKEAVIGYGFDEVKQQSDGIYCNGCYTVHKRPTKMYSNGKGNSGNLCKDQVILLYNPEDAK